MIPFCILFTHFDIEGLSATVSCSLIMHSKYCKISDTEYDSSNNSSFSFHVGPDILNLLFWNNVFIFLHIYDFMI